MCRMSASSSVLSDPAFSPIRSPQGSVQSCSHLGDEGIHRLHQHSALRKKAMGKLWRLRGQSWLHDWINHFTSWALRNILYLTLGNSEFSILLVKLLLNYLWRHASYFLYSFYFKFCEPKHLCWSQFCVGGDNGKESGGGQRSKLIIHVRDREGSLRSVIKDNCPQRAHLLPDLGFKCH